MFRRLARLISLLAAAGLSLAILINPRFIATESSQVPHGAFALTMIGVCLCWLHAFDFRPSRGLLRHAVAPLPAWHALGLGLALLIR